MSDWFLPALTGIALAVGIAGYRTARAALQAAHASDRRSLRASILEGQACRRVRDDTREYALRVSLTNDSGVPCTIASTILRVTYRTRANFLGAVDLPPEDTKITDTKGATGNALELSLPLIQGQTTQGWLFFRTTNVIPRHCRVDDYTLILTCDAGRRVLVDASLPAMLADDTDGTGPATWGWD